MSIPDDILIEIYIDHTTLSNLGGEIPLDRLQYGRPTATTQAWRLLQRYAGHACHCSSPSSNSNHALTNVPTFQGKIRSQTSRPSLRIWIQTNETEIANSTKLAKTRAQAKLNLITQPRPARRALAKRCTTPPPEKKCRLRMSMPISSNLSKILNSQCPMPISARTPRSRPMQTNQTPNMHTTKTLPLLQTQWPREAPRMSHSMARRPTYSSTPPLPYPMSPCLPRWKRGPVVFVSGCAWQS